MKNVTITLDEATASWARVEAARQGRSLSRYIAGLLGERRDQQERKEHELPGQREALEDFLSGPGYPGIGKSWRGREELHAEREDELLRRHKPSGLRARSRRAGKAAAGGGPAADGRRKPRARAQSAKSQ
jgi:hypothetical protein